MGDEVEQEERTLKPTKSFHKFKDVNKKILQKVRSRAFESVGGSVSSLQSDAALFKDFPNLRYDDNEEKLNTGTYTDLKINNMLKARKHYINHQKEEVAPPAGAGDPSIHRKQALRKMKLVDVPKNPKTKSFLMQCLAKNISFASFTDEQLNLIIQALKPKKVAKDVTLLKKGDVGTSFFIVQSGTLSATDGNDDDSAEEPAPLCEYAQGDSFGELSLLYGTRRQMTIKTKSLCCLWRLDRMSFKKILAHGEEIDFEVIRNQLKLIPLLTEANVSAYEEQLDFLAQNVHRVKVQKGDVLVSKGDEGHVMYFILKGRVKCTKAGSGRKKGDDAGQHKIIDFVPGDYFGEGSLVARYKLEKRCERIKGAKKKKMFLNKNKSTWLRSANIFATKDSEFFVLDYDAFKRIAEFNDNSFLDLLQQNLGIRMLRSSPFIHRLRKQYQEFLLENLEVLEYENGDVIIQKGEMEKTLFLVVEGRVEVFKKQRMKRNFIYTGYSFGEQYFFDNKPYQVDVIANGKTKIFAMTLTIFSEVFGEGMSLKDIYKTGNPEIDERVDLNFAQLNHLGFGVGNMNAIQKCLNSDDPKHQSNVLKKISENFEIDERKSIVKRRVTSVRAKPQPNEEKIAHAIEAQMDVIRSDTVKSANEAKKALKKKPVDAEQGKAQPVAMLKKRFKIVGPVGMGTFGMVKYVRAKEGRGKRGASYALKIIEVAKVVKMGQQESVLNEKNILSELCHPLVLKYVDSFKDKKNLYILTELLTGGELFELIQIFRKKESYMPDENAIFYTACMVETFSYLHKKNVLYRDIKPENIMIDSVGYTRLVDFGFAKKCRFKTFTKCGTAEYFAPELLTRRGYNKSVDLWGIGILTYEMMTGMSPFYSSNHMEMIDYIMHEDPDFGDEFPEDAVDFIDRLLEKEPNDRLGMSLNHPDELKSHPFLKSIDWHKLVCKELPAPYVPKRKKVKVKTEEELRMRLVTDETSLTYEVELKERDFKGWYEEF